MKQQRLAAYLNLIQDLLTCSQGEEWIHLKKQETLVDGPFLQAMEQVATQLARQGDRESATFLHNWAVKLHHILVKEIQPLPEQKAACVSSTHAVMAFRSVRYGCLDP